MVVVGLAVTLAPTVADNAVAGDHVNTVAVPLAVKEVELPEQMVTPEPALTVGVGFTDTVTVAVLLHPAVLAPVTV